MSDRYRNVESRVLLSSFLYSGVFWVGLLTHQFNMNQVKLRKKIPKIVAEYCKKEKVRTLSKRRAFEIVFDRLGPGYAPKQAAITQFIKAHGRDDFIVNGKNLEFQGHFDEDESHRVI